MTFSLQLDTVPVVQKAHIYAMAAHSAVGQLRKYTHEPYICHPVEVATLVAAIPGATEDMIAAALLHDVVEDTKCTLTDIHVSFGADIMWLVKWLTDASKPEDGPRWYRKKIDREHIALAPASAQSIKLCDIYSNCTSIGQHDPKFAKVYFEEKRMQLEVLTLGDPTMRAKVAELLATIP